MITTPDPDLAGYRFSVFELDAQEGELRKQGRLIRLQAQPLQILLALLERPRLIVSRDELRQRLWPDDTFVEFDHSLNTAIKRLRETLGDTASTPQFIETVPRRGYRFAAPVERIQRSGTARPGVSVGRGDASAVTVSDIPRITNGQRPNGVSADVPALAATTAPGTDIRTATATAAPSPQAGPASATSSEARAARRLPLVAAAVLGAAVAAALFIVIGAWSNAPAPRAVSAAAASDARATATPAAVPAQASAPRVAVLAFENLSGDPARAYVADGFTEELVSHLGRLAPGRLGVIARSSSASLHAGTTPLPDIAQALDVDYVIEGSVRADADRYRVAVRLVRTQDLTAQWSDVYDGALLDLIAMQRDVAQQVTRQLAISVLPDDQAALARATTSDSRAYDAYLHGVSELARGPADGFARAEALFRRAIALDPRYALAHAGLAQTAILQQDYYIISPARAQAIARASALRALAIDDRLADAHCALADVLSRTVDRPDAADQAFARALALNPSRETTQLRYSTHLIRTGREQEGRARLAIARSLAPRSADVITESAWMEMSDGRLDAAASLADEALRYQPEFPFARYVLGQIALRRSAPDAAIDQFARARITSGHAPKYLAALASAYLAADRPAEAARVLDELRAQARMRYVPPGTIEQIAARLAAPATARR